MKKTRFIFLFLVSCSLTTNTIKPEGSLADKALEAAVTGVIYGVGMIFSQTAYQIIVDKYFPSEKTQADIDSATQQAEAQKEQKKDAELTILEHKQNMLSKAGYSKEEREEMEARIKKTIRGKIDGDVQELSDTEKEALKSKKNASKKNKAGILAKITSLITIAATKTGETADLIASYSFARITNKECFKDTFIGANAQNINRTLVALTTLAICYGGYKVYKNKFSGAYDADDFFDNDDE